MNALTEDARVMRRELGKTDLYWHKCPLLPKLAHRKPDKDVSTQDAISSALSLCDWIHFVVSPAEENAVYRDLWTERKQMRSRDQNFTSLVECGVIGLHWFDANSAAMPRRIDVKSMLMEPEVRIADVFYTVQHTLAPGSELPSLQRLLNLEFKPWFNGDVVRNRVLLNLPSRCIIDVNASQSCILPDLGASGSRELVLGVTQSGAQARYKIVSGVISKRSHDATPRLVTAVYPTGAVYVHMLVLERL